MQLFAGMRGRLSLVLLFSVLLSALACPDGQQHVFPQRNSHIVQDNSDLERKIRPLQWGDVQIIHTTDIHGWYQGHRVNEPNYFSDWGDFSSFVSHMRKLAAKKGVDLLVIDSGDLHDGAGLSDGFPAGQGPDAHVANRFHSMVEYDLLSVGNHELYKYVNALDTFQNFVPQQKGRYVASNVDITHIDADGELVTEPMGERYAKFKTDLGRSVTSLGVMFNFKGQDRNLTVQPPSEMIKEAWFADAIAERPDFFLLNGHMPVRNDDWPVVIDAIRKVHPTVPLNVTGGHTHIRDCFIFDPHAFGIESGRYLETVGWLSFNLTASATDAAATAATPFSRSYIDANRRNYAFHAGLAGIAELATAKGRNITKAMDEVAAAWNLTHVYGTAPSDFFLSRYPPSSNASLLNLLKEEVLPEVISSSNPKRRDIPNIVVVNSGSQRFDLFAGPFTKNDVYVVSPFLNHFLYIDNVPSQFASDVVDVLNRNGESFTGTAGDEDRRVEAIFSARKKLSFDAAAQGTRKTRSSHTVGYVTKDSCPGLGDDTEHLPVPFTPQPDFVASPFSNNQTALKADDLVDLIFIDFVLRDVITALNQQQSQRVYQPSDAKYYNNLSTQDLYRAYAEKRWN